jgi:leucyl/phenylalanyl-tRNA--protein transferase
LAVSVRSEHALLDWLAKAPYTLRQLVLGTAYVLVPRRLPGLLPLAVVTLRDLPHLGRPLVPDPAQALDHPDGLCGLAGRIGVPELLAGYARGMFAMSHTGPLKWWAPRHRMVLFFDQARIEKTTRRLLRGQKFRVTFDRAFIEVMRACAEPRPGRTPLTWITPRVQALFADAHTQGHAHSVEVWEGDVLVGGAFGIAVGAGFSTESQFHTSRDASKVGFAVLNRHLQAWGFAFNDGKHPTRYLVDCGMLPVARSEFSRLAATHAAAPGRPGRWEIDPALVDDRWEPARASGWRMAELLPDGSKCPWSVDELLSTRRSHTW